MDRNRNDAMQIVVVIVHASLSARRAWIEIEWWEIVKASGVVALRKESVDRNSKSTLKRGGYAVALRKESVDRNKIRITPIDSVSRSLSARRAWIEIETCPSVPKTVNVALRKESVDRNSAVMRQNPGKHCRSPQGERG